VRRFEDERLITGNGRYVADLVPDDALHLWFVRSPVAHGELRSIDSGAALSMPGVVAVYTAADLALDPIPDRSPPWFKSHQMPRRPLVTDRVRYAGDPIAVVVAGSSRQAEDAAEMVWPEIEQLPSVLTFDDAVADDVVLFPNAGSNVVAQASLEAGEEPDLGDLVEVVVDVEHPRLAPSPIEALTILATPVGDGLHVHVGHQAPHEMRDDVVEALGLVRDQVRVTVPDVGGAFGMKRLYPEYLVACKVALLQRRPVAWIQPRREIFAGGTHGRAMRHRVSLWADEAGRVHKAHMRLQTEAGAYPQLGSRIALFTRLVAAGQYDIPRFVFELTSVVTNKAPIAPYRGAGRPEAALAIERAMDAVARALHLDPVDVRRVNFITKLPHETPTGATYDSGDYRAALDRALELLDYEGTRAEQARRRAAGETPIGIGIASFIERAGGAIDSGEYASAAIAGDGTLVVRSGSAPSGQGHETLWRSIAASVFGVDPATVALHMGDTAEVPQGTGTYASRSVQLAGSSILRMARLVRGRAVAVAARMLEAAEADVEVASGEFRVAGVPGAAVTLAQVAAAAAGTGESLFSEELYVPGAQTFPYGVHAAVVEVDIETGLVTIDRMVAVDDVGNVLDPMSIEGQLVGSIVQGVGAALFEEMRYDESGQPLTVTFMDYLMPQATLRVDVSSDRIVSPAPSNDLGAKGAGEGGCIGMPAAIVNAAIDALTPYGVTDLQIPLQPQRVWAALQAAVGKGPP